MSWFNDKLDAGTAKLMIDGAGSGARALGAVARIPLDIADRKQSEFDSETKRIKAMSAERRAEINALAKVKAAELGYSGKELDAKAKILAKEMDSLSRGYVADVGLKGKKVTAKARDKATDAYTKRTEVSRANNIDDNFTKQVTDTDKHYTQREVAKLNLKGKKAGVKPKQVVKIGEDGRVIEKTITKPYMETNNDYSTDKRTKKQEKLRRMARGQ